MRGIGTVNSGDVAQDAPVLVTQRVSDSLIRWLWWLFLTAEYIFILVYLLSPFTSPWGNPGLWRVSAVFVWTLSCRLVFWKNPTLGASAFLIGVMLTIPLLVAGNGGVFDTAFARLTVLSLPSLFLAFLWGWRGAVASALSSLPILLLSQSTFSEDALIGLLLLLTTILSGAYIHHLLINMQRVQSELRNMAMRDALTRLGNRYALEIDFQTISASGCLSMWDVNGLKRVNDQHGHHAGDQYLLQFVQVYANATTDPLYRVGGDEFVGLHASSREMWRLHEAVLRGFPNVSSGWAEVDGRDLDAVLRDADAVMYRDKNRRVTQILTPELLAALERDELHDSR